MKFGINCSKTLLLISTFWLNAWEHGFFPKRRRTEASEYTLYSGAFPRNYPVCRNAWAVLSPGMWHVRSASWLLTNVWHRCIDSPIKSPFARSTGLNFEITCIVIQEVLNMNVQLIGHVSFPKLLITYNGIWYRQSTLQWLDTFYLGSHKPKIFRRNQYNQHTFNTKDK